MATPHPINPRAMISGECSPNRRKRSTISGFRAALRSGGCRMRSRRLLRSSTRFPVHGDTRDVSSSPENARLSSRGEWRWPPVLLHPRAGLSVCRPLER